MINEIINQMSQVLKEEFGEQSAIYMEEIEEGLEIPCFLITLLNPVQKPFPGKRYYQKYPFCIQYISKKNSRLESNVIYEQLVDCLEWIEVKGDLLHGSKIKSSYADGRLKFYISYNFFVYRKEKKEERMEQIKINQRGEK